MYKNVVLNVQGRNHLGGPGRNRCRILQWMVIRTKSLTVRTGIIGAGYGSVAALVVSVKYMQVL
jgi:hypothetical protein